MKLTKITAYLSFVCLLSLSACSKQETIAPMQPDATSTTSNEDRQNRFLFWATTEVDHLEDALAAGNATKALGILQGKTAQELEDLGRDYFQQTGKDIEYDMRGWGLNSPLVGLTSFSKTSKGLKGADLTAGFDALYRPKLTLLAAQIDQWGSSRAGRQRLYEELSLLGGEGRALLGAIYLQLTGKDLVQTLSPIFLTAIAENQQIAISSPANKTVAVVVSSGNWQAMIHGGSQQHIGGYHWREIEAYVKEALDRGYTPVIFTPHGLPASPDAASLLRGRFGPKVGFGLRPGTGPDSYQGQAIMQGFAAPRPISSLQASNFASIHIAGGHGSHYDLVGNPAVANAASRVYYQNKVVTAVCHASPALGSLLQGGKATAFSPQIDVIMVKAGYVLPEFQPPYDAHQGLQQLGVQLTALDRTESFVNIHHWEVYYKNSGIPIYTGTGPEATDDVARRAFNWLQ